ncbi:hypothetical protein LAZ67_X003298 [Cordylochernes scorpioides]|uniref:Transposase n=1 Tax=Cordylochernes scorpioides TaxID=51811 RepID=A0ABY6LY67_9ARAC|nr:hypothetical protein LAZ67_X003298 [Cordylochernes scorpioides]
MLPWPPYSPDLSPIEHVWDIIGRRLHALPQPRSEDELWQMVEREWRAIPQDAICTLIDSLPRRVAACIAVRGPDLIHGHFLIDLSPKGKDRLLEIFNLSWKKGKLPEEWKSTTVIPLLKPNKGRRSPSSYRPIPLTSTASKSLGKNITQKTFVLPTTGRPNTSRVKRLPPKKFNNRSNFLLHSKHFRQSK